MTELQHKFVNTNGIRMHYVEQGTGPLVVLCHGWPESWYSYRHQIPALAGAGYRVVAPDQRGYGQTDKPEAVDAYNAATAQDPHDGSISLNRIFLGPASADQGR